MKKQTAVQWLIYTMQNSLMEQKEVEMAFEQALQMERNQMLEASISGSSGISFEDYYQTFKP